MRIWFAYPEAGFAPCKPPGTAHVVLAGTGNGKPALTRYHRIIIEVGQ